MPYALQFQATDTLDSSGLASGSTTATLTSGNFGSPSGTQLYVVDYGVPGTAEIISATVSGTSVTGITRGLAGGASGTTVHAGGATVGAFFVPQHYSGNYSAVTTSGVSTGTAVVPFDNSVPQNTEGTQFMSASITPTSSTNVVRVEVQAHASATAAGHLTMALFKGAAASAVAATTHYETTTGGALLPLTLVYEGVSGSTSAITFAVRIGNDAASTVTFNGTNGNAVLGGTLASFIRVTEIKS